MECDRIKKLISKYVDKEIENKDNSLINNHISSCKDCKKYYDDLVKIKNIMNNMSNVEIPPFLFTRVKEKIRDNKQYGFKLNLVYIFSGLILFIVSGIIGLNIGGYIYTNKFFTSTDYTKNALAYAETLKEYPDYSISYILTTNKEVSADEK